MRPSVEQRLTGELEGFKRDGVYKRLNYLDSPQASHVAMEGRGDVIILSSNNYLGLCTVPEVVRAGHEALERFGAGTASVRFICGTFSIHRELEAELASFVGTEASLSFGSCWTANEAVCPTLLGPEDIVISDQLNHASIIDSVRLARQITKCQHAVYRHSDMKDLEEKLQAAKGTRTRLIFTDGIFSMEGDTARLADILTLARKYDAAVAVDDSHATGVLGRTGRGTPEHTGTLGEVDIITSTLGKALGGAAGGFAASSTAFCDYLTQRSRPQLFSNALPCTIAGSAMAAVRYLRAHPQLITRLREDTAYSRDQLKARGFKPLDGDTPIIPVILGEPAKAIQLSEMLLAEGVFVTGCGYSVVPKGESRVTCEISATGPGEAVEQGM